MYKNVIAYRLNDHFELGAEALVEQFSKRVFAPCSKTDLSTIGWVPCNSDGLVSAQNGCYRIRLRIEKKVLPSKAIKKYAEDLAMELERQQGYAPMRELKERALMELAARALCVSEDINAWFDMKEKFFYVATGSYNKADTLISFMRKSMDELPLSMISTRISPSSFMAELIAGDAPDALTVDRACTLVGAEKESIKYANHPLEHDVVKHLSEGKVPKSLAMTFNDAVSFELDEKMVIKKISLLTDAVLDDAKGDAEVEDQIRFTLLSSEIRGLTNRLISWMGGEARDE